MYRLKTLGAAILILLVASVAGAAGPVKGPFKETVKLATSDYGLEFKAFGYCTLMRGNGVEMIGLRVFADLPDDTNLIVEVATDQGSFQIGTIRMFLGSGALILYSSDQPSPAFPLRGIQAVTVHDTNDKLMTYTWEAKPGVSIK